MARNRRSGHVLGIAYLSAGVAISSDGGPTGNGTVFRGVTATFTPGSDTYLTELEPSAAVDGPITVTLANPLGQQVGDSPEPRK